MNRALPIFVAASLCGLAVLAPSSAFAVAHTINFDDFKAPIGFEGGPPPLRDRYAAQGATFRGPDAASGGTVLDQDGGFGVTGFSPRNFLAFQAPGAYRGPETISFSSPTTFVSINVGHANAGTISLTALDGINKVGTDSRTGTAALAPLTVTASRITGARLSFTSTKLVADDLQYEVPAQPKGSNPATPPGTLDLTNPALGVLGFSATVFRAAGSGPSISAKSKAPLGTKVSFTLSEPGAVKFTVQRKTRGRKVGRKCVKARRSNRERKACIRWAKLRGSFTIQGNTGKNSFKFRGRIGGRKLKPGRYRLSSVATDAAGNKSAVMRKRFKIVR